MRACIVTGADAKYFHSLAGLLSSLAPLRRTMDVVVFDFGLTPEQSAAVAALGARVQKFACPFDYPARRQVEAKFPGFGAMLARPYLNELVPGYDVLVWIDADAWVQLPEAIEDLGREASDVGLAAVPEIDRAYVKFLTGNKLWDYENRIYERCFGATTAQTMRLVPVINSGVWAARRDSQLWSAWATWLRAGLDRLTEIDDDSRLVEQAAFNVAIAAEKTALRRFPATYNWLVCLAFPAWDVRRKLLVDPNPPHDPIRIVHVSSHFIGRRIALPLIGHNNKFVHDVTVDRDEIRRLAKAKLVASG